MALVNINEGLKEEYSMNKIFSAEYDFSCVRQIAHADRFARVLTRVRAIARVKRKGLKQPLVFKMKVIKRSSYLNGIIS